MTHKISLAAISQCRAMVNTGALTEDALMSRHLDNLKRLWSKLQLRYGDDDALVLEVKREIEALEARGANRSVPYRNFIRAQTGNEGRSEMSAQLTH
jgi:hypothetical protein